MAFPASLIFIFCYQPFPFGKNGLLTFFQKSKVNSHLHFVEHIRPQVCVNTRPFLVVLYDQEEQSPNPREAMLSHSEQLFHGLKFIGGSLVNGFTTPKIPHPAPPLFLICARILRIRSIKLLTDASETPEQFDLIELRN